MMRRRADFPTRTTTTTTWARRIEDVELVEEEALEEEEEEVLEEEEEAVVEEQEMTPTRIFD